MSIWVNKSCTAEIWTRATTRSLGTDRGAAHYVPHLHLPLAGSDAPAIGGQGVVSPRVGAGFDSGLVTTLSSATQLLEVVLASPGGGRKVLASFDMGNNTSSGVISDGWNLIRVEMEGERVQIWANPQFPDAVPGYGTKIQPMAPRIAVTVAGIQSEGAFGVASGNTGGISLDYVSAVPLGWAGRGTAAAGAGTTASIAA